MITVFNPIGQDSFAATTTIGDENITIGITFSNNQSHSIAAVEKTGAKAFSLPLVTNKTEAKAALSKVDALIISGGSSVVPSHYGAIESDKIEYVAPERDISDMIMLRVAKELDMPVLGICRGSQLMNVVQGGTLYQDINSEYPNVREDVIHRDPNGKKYVQHLINIEPGSKLYNITKSSNISVKSFHHQAVKDLGKDLVITARSEDGIVEAFEFTNQTFMMGLQSHPEVSVSRDNDEKMIALFNELKAQGKEYRHKIFPTLTAPSIAVAYLYDYDKAKVCWDTVDNVSGYAVYYKRATSTSYSLLGRTSKAYLNTGGLRDGIKYDFKIVPYIMRTGTYYHINQSATTSICTMKKLGTPLITHYADTYLRLTWNGIQGHDGYQVSRSTSSTGTNVVSTKTLIRELSRDVTYGATIGRPYYYKVRAYKLVAGTRIYAPWSATVKYTRQLPAPSTVKAVRYKKHNAKVTWRKVSGASGYAVYYKKGSSSKYSLMGRTNSLQMIKKKISKSAKYYFKVVPYYQNGSTRYYSKNYATTRF